jgi:hypothetical protein
MLNLDDVKQMLTHAGDNILSLYLHVDNAVQGNQASTPAWQSWLRHAVQETAKSLPENAQAVWEETMGDVRTFLDNYSPSSKSLALFTGPEFDEIQIYELSVPVENQIAFGAPQLGPLLWVIDEYEPYLVVLVDQEEARFFTTSLGSVGFDEVVERSEDKEWRNENIPFDAGSGAEGVIKHGGDGKDSFEKRMEEQREHLYRDVVAHIEKLMQRHNAQRLILGGAEQSAHAVLNTLPDKLKPSVVGVLPIPIRTNTQQIFEQVLAPAQEFERQKEMELVTQVIDFARSGGRGALGRKAVLDAMEMQRVELLVMAWPAADPAFASDLALRVLTMNSEIELVHGEAADLLRNEDGLAARLYYAL